MYILNLREYFTAWNVFRVDILCFSTKPLNLEPVNDNVEEDYAA